MYNKGAASERELIKKFSEKGFRVIRAAGSGVNSLSPDILVFTKGKYYGFECKAWKKKNLRLSKEQFERLQDWINDTGITVMVAWKIPRKGWYFIPLDEFKQTPKAYTLSMCKALQMADFDMLV
jgi:Holliday junction resolvase